MRRMTLKSISFLVSVGVSFIVCVLTAYWVLYCWYPGVYADILHVYQYLFLLIVVDVCMSVVAPWIAWRGVKSTLQRCIDAAFIGIFRVVAVVYLAHQLFVARPVAMVFAQDHLELVSAFQLQAIDERAVSLPGLWGGGPIWLSVAVPRETDARQAALFFELAGGNLSEQSKYWAPYDHKFAVDRGMAPLELGKKDGKFAPQLEQLVRVSPKELQGVKALPLKTRFGFSTVLIGVDKPVVAGWLDWDPD